MVFQSGGTGISHYISFSHAFYRKILTGLDNYEVNTGTMHPFAVKRNESGLGTRSGASVPLTQDQNFLWNCEISIGTPPKIRMVTIDTGAADMWVLQTGCNGISGDRDLWDPNSSESAKKQDQPFQLKYGLGTAVNGDRYTDNVTIAGLTADPQTFGSVTSYTAQKIHGTHDTDGLLGLALPLVSELRVNPLIESLYLQDKITSMTFSLNLASGAEIYIGGANRMLYKGDIAYTRVINSGLWQVTMDDLRVNGNPILKNVPAIFDTGANYIFGVWDQVSELYGHIGGQLDDQGNYGLYSLPCDSFPTMSFTFGGKTFQIPPELLNLGRVSRDIPFCRSAILGRRTYRFWSIGIPFLQSVYSVFDYSTELQARVGFAELA